MNMRCLGLLLGMCVSVSVSALGARGPASSLEAERLELLSRLQAMGHGYFTQAEWADALSRLNDMLEQAERKQAHDELIDLRVIQAMVYSDMRSEHQRAIDLLRQTLSEYRDRPYDNVRRVYVKLAEVYARVGDEAAIGALIEGFRDSRHYDPTDYGYEGGLGRDVPLAVTRPRVGGSESITVTTMQKFKQQARFAPGQLLPDFAAIDVEGNALQLSDFRGQVVLVDFYVPEWTVWKRDLPNLKSVYRRYHPYGFEIIGVYMRRDVEVLRRFVRANNMDWPQIGGDMTIPAQYGIFGEARNFLIDPTGVIIGRDLRGSDLVEAIRHAL